MIKRKGPVKNKDGKSIATYEKFGPFPCRKSSLSYKDLQFLDKLMDVSMGVAKLHTNPDVEMKTGDRVIIDGYEYEIFSIYKAHGKSDPHHIKAFIKFIETNG